MLQRCSLLSLLQGCRLLGLLRRHHLNLLGLLQ